MSNGVVGKELLEERVVAMDAVVASSNEGGVQGGSFPVRQQIKGFSWRSLTIVLLTKGIQLNMKLDLQAQITFKKPKHRVPHDSR